MERERWTELSKAVSKVAACWKESSRRHTHATALIAQVHLWAAAHDRPISWACVSENWESRSRPKVPLADQSTMSRRTRTRSFTAFMDAVGQQMNGDGGGDKPSTTTTRTTTLIKRIDGKALVVAAHSKDPNAAWGRGAGQKSQGREEDKRNRKPLFVRVQAGRDKPPHLVHDERSREHHADDERNLDVERKGLAGLGVDQLDAGRQRPPRRREDEVEDPVDESETEQNADGDRDARIDDALPELVEMLQERHLRA